MSDPCISCKILPKDLPKHRCSWCQLRKDGTDAEAAAAWDRQEKARLQHSDGWETVGFAVSPPWSACLSCESLVPEFYMKTKKRCRGCELLRVREVRDAKTYGMSTGERATWYTAQGGRCFGCGNKQNVTGLAVHHSHLSGEPYFLACMTCNQGVMGTAFDNPQTLIRLGLGMLYPPHKPGNLDKIEKLLKEINET